jgi:hypothetical protein
MNIEHRDIDKFIPYGEALRGFVNQKFITPPVLQSILKERGIFVLNADKDYMVPIVQTLLLSPTEFDKIRDAFARKEDNEKKISREISFSSNATLYQSDIMQMNVEDFLKRQLPTCKIKQAIRFVQTDNNPNHLTAKFTIIRNDINKCWYEQTNEFSGSVEIINGNGKGAIRITHTSPETKDLAEYIVKNQIRQYKDKGLLKEDVNPQKILFSSFTNTTRFVFFFRLTTKIENNGIFTFVDIKDISIKPQDECVLPAEILWMENIQRLIISGKSLNEKAFMKEEKFYCNLELWSIEATFEYDYKGQKGYVCICFGFPDYNSKGGNAEFEVNIKSLVPEKSMSAKEKRDLKSKLLSVMDNQKLTVYSNFLNYLNNRDAK